ncbi:MAG: hypothetical protein IPK07_35020 [Deltaproteobacteria bacterium]|nr:hypothetical protein [Deltaproteobacteria bacterium]
MRPLASTRAGVLVLLACLASVGQAVACTDFAAAPSSRWSVADENGVAWLVTPCGERFFSIGVNGLDGGDGRGRTTPPRAYFWKARYPSFADWLTATRVRLVGWGFNTAGAISAPPTEIGLPSIPSLALGQSAAFHWADPFAPEVAERVRRKAEELVAPYRGQPRRIGYFTDNEVGWWGGALFTFYGKQPASNHTKQEWVALLRSRYRGRWSELVADFVPPEGVTSWDELAAKAGAPTRLRPGGSGIQAVRAFTARVASRYYETVHAALWEADPDALIFGDRLPIYYDPVAVRAMAPYVDAIATNYNPDAGDGWIARYFFDGLRRLAPGKPVLVSEWFFAARENRTGNLNNGHLMTVATQAERARGAAAAARRLAAEPNVVGLHWFQYYDHPLGGRPVDGEDYDFGLVDVDDRPYAEVTEELAEANAALPGEHERARPRLRGGSGADAPVAVPFATVDPDDATLSDWPKDAAWIPGLSAPEGEVPFGDLYWSWSAAGLAVAMIAMDYYDPALLAFDGEFPVDEALHLDLGLDAGGGPRRFVLSVVPPRVFEKRAAPAFEPRLAAAGDAGERAAVPGARLRYFGSDQPRYVVEAVIPWTALAVEQPPSAGAPLSAALAVTAFHRARWMSLGGRAPDELLAGPRSWRAVSLAAPPSAPPSAPSMVPSALTSRSAPAR